MRFIKNIGIIGAGKMGTTILNGLKGLHQYKLSYYNPSPRNFDQTIYAYSSVEQLITNNDVLFLCTLPSQVKSVLSPYQPLFKNKMLVSVAAGLSIKEIQDTVGKECKVIRTMPNTPCKVNKGIIAYSLGENIDSSDEILTKLMLSSMGVSRKVDEKLMDPISGLSGSGPAYVCLFVEALADGGVRAGIPRDLAYELACHTLIGTASMILETKQHPGSLKDEVSSPGGATIEGIFHLEQSGLRYSVMQAVLASSTKCKSFSSS